MVTMAQRIEALRTEAGLARVPPLWSWDFPKTPLRSLKRAARPLRRSSRKRSDSSCVRSFM